MTVQVSAKVRGPVSYREFAPSPDLAHVVLSYWEFAVADDTKEPFTHQVFADGCVSLAYHRNIKKGVSRLHVVGPRLDSFGVEVCGGDNFWGARFSPAACSLVLGFNPATLQDQILNFSQPAPAAWKKLLRQLSRTDSFGEAVAAYGSFLRSLGLKPTDVDQGVATAVRLIEASQGRARVAEVAAEVGLSVRQLERRFRAAAGLTPKQFARIRRVRATAVTLVKDKAKDWAARATEMGFADQSHLAREIAAVTGRSPVPFAEDVAEIEHGNLVE